MKVDIITLFPEMCRAPLMGSILGKAMERGLWELGVHDLRQWSTDRHRRVDDTPYGGGQGMVMQCAPLFAAVEALATPDSRVVLMTPQGRRLDQRVVESYTACRHLIILCGHYEGIDHRVVETLVHDEISLGDYVLTNGAIAATILTDAVIRLLPGVLGDERSSQEESFSAATGLLEAPCYTKPVEFRGLKVPDILLSGHHANIAKWKAGQSLRRTQAMRPDLLREHRAPALSAAPLQKSPAAPADTPPA
ncbi:MAG: tRNA (guanine-N1)-methyltransferase [Verrucomicrobiales bacterium]|nr:tRNA (guanine-N1)-methyltransferase [Verrucomicrobiales bacterium]